MLLTLALLTRFERGVVLNSTHVYRYSDPSVLSIPFQLSQFPLKRLILVSLFIVIIACMISS